MAFSVRDKHKQQRKKMKERENWNEFRQNKSTKRTDKYNNFCIHPKKDNNNKNNNGKKLPVTAATKMKNYLDFGLNIS